MDSQLVLKAGVLIKQSLKRILNFDFDISLKRKRSSFKSEELKNFCKLLDDERVKCFLLNDPDYMLADNYLIAMTCIYFIRAQLTPAQYDAQHFFSALYLAHQFEEDWEQFRCEIVPWFPPTDYQQSCTLNLNQIKNYIWKRMDYDCLVSKDLCDELKQNKSVERYSSKPFKLVEVPNFLNHKESNNSAASLRRKRQEIEDELDSKKRIEEGLDESLKSLENLNFQLLTQNESSGGLDVLQTRQEIEDELDSKKRIDADLDEDLENRNLDEENEELLEESDDQYLIDELPDPVTIKKGLQDAVEDVIEPKLKEANFDIFDKPKDGPEYYLMRETFTWKVWGRIREHEHYMKAISNVINNKQIYNSPTGSLERLQTSEWEIDSSSSSSSVFESA